MFIYTSTLITDISGTPLQEGGKLRTIGDTIVEALLAQFPSERDLPGKDKFERWTLAQKIAQCNGMPVEVSIEEAALIKRLVGLGYGPLVVGQIWTAFEEGSTSKPDREERAIN